MNSAGGEGCVEIGVFDGPVGSGEFVIVDFQIPLQFFNANVRECGCGCRIEREIDADFFAAFLNFENSSHLGNAIRVFPGEEEGREFGQVREVGVGEAMKALPIFQGGELQHLAGFPDVADLARSPSVISGCNHQVVHCFRSDSILIAGGAESEGYVSRLVSLSQAAEKGE